MTAPFELEITACAGGAGHVTTAVEVQTLADLESLSRAVSESIRAWQESRDNLAAFACTARPWPSCSRPDGQSIRHWVRDPWWTNTGAPCSTEDPSDQRFLAECAKDCRCEGPEFPCAGVTAGGICDEMKSRDDDDWDDDIEGEHDDG